MENKFIEHYIVTFVAVVCLMAEAVMPIILTKIYNVELVGSLLLTVSILGLIVPVSLWGRDTIILKEINTTAVGLDIIRAVLPPMLSTFAITLIIAFITLTYYEGSKFSPFILIAGAPLLVLISIFSALLRCVGLPSSSLFLKKALPAISLVMISAIGSLFLDSLPSINLIYLVSLGLPLLISVVIIKRTAISLVWNYRVSPVEYLREGFPYFIFSISFSANLLIDRLALGAFTSLQDITSYSIAVGLVAVGTVGHVASATILPPHIAGLYKSGNHRMASTLAVRHSRASSTIFLSVALCLVFLSEEIAPSVQLPVLIVLLTGGFANVSSGVCGYALTMTGRQRTAFQVVLLSIFINLCLSLSLVHHFGQLRIALGSAASQLTTSIIMAICVRRQTAIATDIFGDLYKRAS